MKKKIVVAALVLFVCSIFVSFADAAGKGQDCEKFGSCVKQGQGGQGQGQGTCERKRDGSGNGKGAGQGGKGEQKRDGSCGK